MKWKKPKGIFFWDQSQDMSSSSFPPKKQASDWLTYLVYQSEACFLERNHFLTWILEKADFSMYLPK